MKRRLLLYLLVEVAVVPTVVDGFLARRVVAKVAIICFGSVTGKLLVSLRVANRRPAAASLYI